jgi:hypothetical protein
VAAWGVVRVGSDTEAGAVERSWGVVALVATEVWRGERRLSATDALEVVSCVLSVSTEVLLRSLVGSVTATPLLGVGLAGVLVDTDGIGLGSDASIESIGTLSISVISCGTELLGTKVVKPTTMVM